MGRERYVQVGGDGGGGGGGGSWEWVDDYESTGPSSLTIPISPDDGEYFMDIAAVDKGTGGILADFKINGSGTAAGQETSVIRAKGNPEVLTAERELRWTSGVDTLGDFTQGGATLRIKLWLFPVQEGGTLAEKGPSIGFFSQGYTYTGKQGGFIYGSALASGVLPMVVPFSFTVFDLRSTNPYFKIALFRAKRE